jgi:ADP-ribose pyrophosphatase
MKTIKKWEKISQEVVFEKYGRRILKNVYKLPDERSDDYYLVDQGRAVAMLALTKEGNVLVVEQYRPGPNEVLMELPGGIINKDESPAEAALRELAEETGYQGDAEHFIDVYDDAYSTMTRSCVILRNCKKIAKQKLDENEFISVKEIELNEFRKLLRSGKMTDVEVAYLCLDYLGLL